MPEKKQTIVDAGTATSPLFECGQCEFKTRDIQKHQEHLIDNPHSIYSGNYQCKLCRKTVTIVPDYIDKPAPDSQLPSNNTELVHKKFIMIKKRPTQAQVSGGLGVCDNCRQEMIKQLA